MRWIMPWNRWYSFKSYVGSALWVVPLIALVLELLVKRVSERFGRWMVSEGYYDLTTGFYGMKAAEAQGVLDRIFTLNLSFLVFTFGSLLVAIQVAGGQYTPRIIATTLLRDNVIRYIVGLFVFTLLWANRTIIQLGNPQVPQFQVFLAMLFGLVSLVAFLLLIDYSAKLLRPISLAARIGESGIAVIESVYPQAVRGVIGPRVPAAKRRWGLLSWGKHDVSAEPRVAAKHGAPDRTVDHRGTSGVLLAVNVPALIEEARRADCVVELAPQVGDFVAIDEPLFYIYGNAGAVDDRRLRALVAFGVERTMEQDPLFAFRILADIALKALSPAINDPTTAVLAIDQLHRLLRMVGLRSLRTEEFADFSGNLRLIFRTPNWENFVHITFREIRECGGNSLQVVRRLRAMIENLFQTLAEDRHAALREELNLLDRAITRHFQLSEDLALARIPDAQGMGGSTRK
jgi:uncharacterized membrane protein